MEKPSPIVLFAYNRPWHTRKTFEALAANDLAIESELFIFSDGARTLDDEASVMEVRNYLRCAFGYGVFKSVNIIERDKNLGLASSIITGVTEIVNRFGRVIVLDDDMVTSPYFLRFMNDALDRYENEERVISIHGYMYPVRGALPKTFFLRDTGCWGWATWSRGWRLFNQDGVLLFKEIQQKKLCYDFDMDGSYPFTEMLQKQVHGINESWAIRWQASAFLKGKLTLFPGISLVKNIGHDNSGVHSDRSNAYNVTLADTQIEVADIPVEENYLARKKLIDYFFSLYPFRIVRFLRRAFAAVRAIVRSRFLCGMV